MSKPLIMRLFQKLNNQDFLRVSWFFIELISNTLDSSGMLLQWAWYLAIIICLLFQLFGKYKNEF